VLDLRRVRPARRRKRRPGRSFLEKGLITYLQGQRVARKDFQADASKPKFRNRL
jgi:hypothetical protein